MSSEEGSYDAPVAQMAQPSNTRSERIEKIRQRREEIAQSAQPVSSVLTSNAPPSPIVISNDQQSSSDATIRTNLVQEATEFLANPKVVSASMAAKRKFLSTKKGLTEAEIDEAVRRSNAIIQGTGSTQTASSAVQQIQQAPPQYYTAPVVYSAPPIPPIPQQSYPSLKSIAFIVVVCVGIGSAVVHFVKKYVIAYWWPKKNTLTERAEKLESTVNAVQEQVNKTTTEVREAISVIRTFLESQLNDWGERQRLEDLRLSAEQQALSDLKRDVNSVRHLLPSITSIGRNSSKTQGISMDALEEIKNELSSLKSAIKNHFISSTPYSSALSRTVSSPIGSTGQPSQAINSVATSQASTAASTNNTSTASNTTAETASNLNGSSATPTSLTASRSKRQLPNWMSNSSSAVPTWQLAASDTPSPTVESKPEQLPSPNINGTETKPTVAEEITSIPNANVAESEVVKGAQSNAKPAEISSSKQENSNSTTASDNPPYPAQYLEVLSMIQKGITPPGVKTDVDDKVRDPTAPLQPGSLSQQKKPFQTPGANGGTTVEELMNESIPKSIGGPFTPTESDEEM